MDTKKHEGEYDRILLVARDSCLFVSIRG